MKGREILNHKILYCRKKLGNLKHHAIFNTLYSIFLYLGNSMYQNNFPHIITKIGTFQCLVRDGSFYKTKTSPGSRASEEVIMQTFPLIPLLNNTFHALKIFLETSVNQTTIPFSTTTIKSTPKNYVCYLIDHHPDPLNF